MQSFREKGLPRWEGELETAESAPIIHLRKKSNASMPWEIKTPKPSPPSLQKFVCHRSITFDSTSRKWGRLSPHSGQPRPSPHIPPRELSHGRRLSSELFSLISIVRRALCRISTTWQSHPHFPSRRDFHLEKNSRSISARGGPCERLVLFQYQSRTPWPMCPPRRHLWRTCGHRHEVPQMQLRSWCERV